MEPNNANNLGLSDLPEPFMDRGLADRQAADELMFDANCNAIGNTIESQWARIGELRHALRYAHAYLATDGLLSGKHERAMVTPTL